MKILLVGGGTGGHIYPLISLANHWKKKNHIFHFLIAKNNSDFEILKKTEFKYSELPVAKFRRYFSIKNFLDFFIFIGNIFRSFFILKKQKPDIIFSKGGFVSLPIGIVAKILHIPFYLHETDSRMGLSNTLLSHFSKKIFTGFPSKNPHYLYVGNPVREEFFKENKKSKQTSTQKILIFGGSQGAVSINKWAREFFSETYLKSKNMTVLLITGKGKKYSPNNIHNIHKKRFTEVEFLHSQFIEKIHEADIVITRAGGSIFELAASKKCTVVIPLPSSANNHQYHNAKVFEQKNAILLIEEKNLYSVETKKRLEKLFSSPSQQKIFSRNIAMFAKKNVANKIEKEIFC